MIYNSVAFWKMERFVRNLMWTTITLGLLVVVCHHLSALWWIVMKILCSFCVVEMRHAHSQCGWQELCPNQIMQLLALILDRFMWSIFDRRYKMKMWFHITNHNFRWKVDFEHGPSWIDKVFIFIAWIPQKNHSGSVSIPQKYINFPKDNLARIVQEASHVE